jgi:lipopolysaccharide cholinephosphotransferase
MPFLKIFYNPSKVIELKLSIDYNESKIWLDIFPLDGLPKSNSKVRVHYTIMKQLKNLLYTSIVNTSKLKRGEKVGTYLTKLIGPNRIARWMDAYAKTRCNFENAPFVGNLIWSMTEKEVMEKEQFLETVDLQFEDAIFHAPAFYENYLKSVYGDYMTPPPEDNRHEHLSEFYLIDEEIPDGN